MLSLYNTLTRQQEPFSPVDGTTVRMYNCGPTVYDRVHIGNLRAYIFVDTLRRVLQYEKLTVQQVMNITDVGHLTSDGDSGEDKMSRGLQREGLPVSLDGMRELADRYTRAFEEDIATLNILHPTMMPRASEHISEQIALITTLEQKGFVYRTSDGLYFDTQRDSAYGRLGGLATGDTHARVEENPEKKNARDFALWKFNDALGWESPWGKGFPGWHLECSAMAMKYLGETLDIHTGGIDHISVHHNNEIAQSENATGKPFSRFWVHNNFLTIADEKISKSFGNGITLPDLVARGIAPLAFRYWALTAHYRSAVNFTWEALTGAQTAYEKLRARITELAEHTGGVVDVAYDAEFRAALDDDLNTPQALSYIWELLKDDEVRDADTYATIIAWDAVLGLKLEETETLTIPDDVQALMHRRELARDAKHWDMADTLRQEIEAAGFEVKDTPEGQKLSKK